jgi:Zn-dependent peptidase ImmA (M78 family)
MRAAGSRKSPDERYADVFGRTFLTPVRTVTQKFHEVTAGSSRLTRKHVIVLARYFGVSREAMVRRLEEIGLAKEGTWDWFDENGGITYQHVLEVPNDSLAETEVLEDSPRSNTLRIELLAAEVWRKELLSEGQLAVLLRLDRIQLRELLDEVEEDRSMVDGAPELPDRL